MSPWLKYAAKKNMQILAKTYPNNEKVKFTHM
jgi:hypothetical protein